MFIIVKPLSEETRDEIMRHLEAGCSVRQAAKNVGVSTFSVSTTAKKRGFNFNDKSTEMAAKCKTKYAQAARIDLVAEGINKLREMLPEIDRSKDMRD